MIAESRHHDIVMGVVRAVLRAEIEQIEHELVELYDVELNDRGEG